MDRDVIIKAENVFFSYEEDKEKALNGLNLEIERGKKYAVMGANGSGKSTFFFCCNGLHQPTSGKMYFEGEPFDYSRKGLLKIRQKVGIIFQNPDDQLFSASVFQEISFGALNLGKPEDEVRQEVEAVIEKLGITPFRDKPTHALSGGQKKQVSIADILVMHPEVIILDEPAAALDPYHTTLVNQIVDRMTEEGITVLMATHDVNYAFRWADEILVFKDGRLLMQGEPKEVFSNKEILAQTNLEQPAALELFDSLVRRGILDAALPVPSTLRELEDYISAIR
ncbi:MAG: ATP-binding cassette domain-containing protein [Lachnospiraceae bacterium]|nr:ATP-binding cassette domain-containing protein [Lachnospiraceae bacterium]